MATWKETLAKRSKQDPKWWITNVLGDTLWSKQEEICDSIVECERLAVPASFGCGKSFIAARIGLWFLYNHKPSRVISTAPTNRQIKDLLWSELRTAHSKSKVPLGGTPLTLSLKLNEEQFAVGFSTDDTNIDMFTGYHAPNQLVIFDQAAGIAPTVWEGAEGLMTSANCRWLAISNTAISDSEFANICMPERRTRFGTWHIIPIKATETPNVLAGKNIFPGLIAHDWVEKRKQAWGTEDPLYRIFVEAEFVPTAQMTVIPYPYLIKAYDKVGELGDEIDVGLDVARSGVDSTVWLARSGQRALKLKRVTGNSTMEVVGETIEFVRYLEERHNRPVRTIKIDTIGLGAGVYDRLIEQDFPAQAVNNAEVKVVIDKDRYHNVRAEMAWAFRHRFEHGEIGLADLDEDQELYDYLKGDLAAQKYRINSSGRIQLHLKEDIKKVLGRSPDYYDAAVMAYEEPGGGPAVVEFVRDKHDEVTVHTISDEEWAWLIGQQEIRIDDPSFHDIY